MTWVNSQYREIKFKESQFENETVVIAMYKGQKAGLGRLQLVHKSKAELGGIYVLPDFRGKGLAREIVSTLLKLGEDLDEIYCLPFSHLETFYSSFGFIRINDLSCVPRVVIKKHSWCNRFYSDKTLLLKKELK